MLASLAIGWMLWTLFAAVQTSVVFPEPSASTAPAPPAAAQLWELETGRAWYLPARGPAPSNAPRLVFMLHGNGELARHWLRPLSPLAELGWGTVVIEYPGYDSAGPRPSIGRVRNHLNAVYDYSRNNLQPSLSVGWGRSLGGLMLAGSQTACALDGLLLFSTFADLSELATTHGWPSWMAPAGNVHSLESCPQAPLSHIWHGRSDSLVPPAMALKLGQVLDAPVHWQACGHNDCPLPWPEIAAVLERFAQEPRMEDLSIYPD